MASAYPRFLCVFFLGLKDSDLRRLGFPAHLLALFAGARERIASVIRSLLDAPSREIKEEIGQLVRFCSLITRIRLFLGARSLATTLWQSSEIDRGVTFIEKAGREGVEWF